MDNNYLISTSPFRDSRGEWSISINTPNELFPWATIGGVPKASTDEEIRELFNIPDLYIIKYDVRIEL